MTRQTILSHAEVQPTLGVKQRGKWDIAWIPGMAGPDDPVKVGDRLRALISGAVAAPKPVAAPSAPEPKESLLAALFRAILGIIKGKDRA